MQVLWAPKQKQTQNQMSCNILNFEAFKQISFQVIMNVHNIQMQYFLEYETIWVYNLLQLKELSFQRSVLKLFMGQRQSTIYLYLEQLAKIQTCTQHSYLFQQFTAFMTQNERLDKQNRQFMLSANKLVIKFAKQVQKIEEYEGEISVVSKRNAGQKLFEGTLRNGMKEGYGKQYNPTGKFIYEGNYHKDLYEGWGMTANYQGQFKRGKKEGWGIWQDKERGLRYEGCFIQDKFHGLGYLNVQSSDLQRFLQQNVLVADPSILVQYAGEWKNGKLHGQGKLVTNQELYTGYFVDGFFEGQGKLVSLNGKQQGKFFKGKKIS